MARRMLSEQIIKSDAFMDLPLEAQALYIHLNLEADDDGFVNAPKRVARLIGADVDNLDLLIAKRFLLEFESGIVVIKHWFIHNSFRKERKKETVYQDELKTLKIKDNGAYTEKVADKLRTVGGQYADKVRISCGQNADSCPPNIN